MVPNWVALLLRKKNKMPAWAITSIVPAVNWSEMVPEQEDPGLIKVGPKTVAKLWSDILLQFSYLLMLFKQINKHK